MLYETLAAGARVSVIELACNSWLKLTDGYCFRRIVVMLTLVTHCIELDPAVLIYLVLYFLRQQLGCRPSLGSEFVFRLWIVCDDIKFKTVAECREVFLHIVKIDDEIDNRFFAV